MRLPLLIAILAAGPAAAQAPVERRPVEEAVARAVAASMPTLEYGWGLRWHGFGNSVAPEVSWFLAPPETYSATPLSPGVTLRRGMLTSARGSISVDVCGGQEFVGAMTFEVSSLWLGDGDLRSELQSLGVGVEELERDDAPRYTRPPSDEAEARWPDWGRGVSRYPSRRLWRLEQPGHEPVLLATSYICTPPGTRHATMCEMSWTVEYRPGPTRRPEPCLLPIEPGAS